MSSAHIDINTLDLGLGPILADPPLQAEVARLLSPEDLVILQTTKLGSETPPLKKVRSIHHHVARLLAAGMKGVEISAVTGMCNSRISILKNDPAFSELVSFYEESEQNAFLDVRETMITLGLDAAQEIHDRILDDADKLGTGTLVQIMTTALDRGGHSPVHKSETTHIGLSPEEIKEIKESASDGGKVNRKEIPNELPGNRTIEVDKNPNTPALTFTPSQSGERVSSEGTSIREESGTETETVGGERVS